MTWGVVICPRCNKVKAADLQFKTTKCLKCSKVIKLDRTPIVIKTDDPDQIPNIVGQVKAQKQGVELPPPVPKKTRPKKKQGKLPGSKREKALLSIVRELSDNKGYFSFDDFSRAVSKQFKGLKKADKEKYLEHLQARGLVIEPRQGVYRAMDEY